MANSYDRIYDIVRPIPHGKVATYGQSASPFRLGTDHLQRSLLEAEGIQFNPQGKVDLGKHLWRPPINDSPTEH